MELLLGMLVEAAIYNREEIIENIFSVIEHEDIALTNKYNKCVQAAALNRNCNLVSKFLDKSFDFVGDAIFCMVCEKNLSEVEKFLQNEKYLNNLLNGHLDINFNDSSFSYSIDDLILIA